MPASRYRITLVDADRQKSYFHARQVEAAGGPSCGDIIRANYLCRAIFAAKKPKGTTVMETVADLWLPILVSSVAVFFASFLAWMVLPHHKADIKFLPDEKSFDQYLTSLNLAPGTYMWPGCNSADDMKSEEYKQRYAAGPWGSLNVRETQPSFGRNLVLVFICYAVISTFVAYLTSQARSEGATFASVFQVAGATAVLAYCAGQVPGAIFFSKPCRFFCTDMIDGVVYGLITGAVFAWLWPATTIATG